MAYQGDYKLAATVDFDFTSHDGTGLPTVLSGSPVVSVYKGSNTTQVTTGVTLTVSYDSVVGLNHVTIDTSDSFYATANDFDVIITTGTVGGISVVGYKVGSFSIENRSPLRPTTAGRTLDVSAGGEAGVDWANVGSPTTTLNLSGTSTLALEPTTAGRKLDVTTTGEAGIDWSNIGAPTTVVGLSGTTIKTATDVETDTQDIQSRLPTALSGGNMKSDVLAISTDTTAADNAESFFDGTGYAGTNNVIPLVTVTTTATTATNLTTNNDKTGYALTAAYDAAKTASQAGDAMALTNLYSPVLQSGTAQAGASGSITLAAGASATDSLYKSLIIKVYGGTGVGQSRVITAYNGTTKVAAVDWNWTTNPDNTSTYAVLALLSPKLNSSGQVIGVSLVDTLTTYTGNTVQTGDSYAIVNSGTFGNAQLVRSTTPANTLDIAATGEVGLDFNNIKDATAGHTLTNITVPLVTTTTTSTNLTTNNDKTGYRLSATGVDDILDEVVEGAYTVRQYLRLYAASLGAKLSGAATTSVAIRDTADTKDRVLATVDSSGNRSAITLDLT